MAEKVLVDINSAEETELDKIPGIGPALAQRIIRSRPYTSQQDLTRVSGIGNSTLGRMKQYMGIEPDKVTTKAVVVAEAAVVTAKAAVVTAKEAVVAEEDMEADLQVAVGTEQAEMEPVVVPDANPGRALAVNAPPSLPLPEIEPELDEESVLTESMAEEDEEIPLEVKLPHEVAVPWEEPIPPVEELMAETDLLTMLPKPSVEVEKDEENLNIPTESAPAGVKSPKFVTRGQFIWVGLLIMVLAMAFGIALSLGILSGINGGLRYVAPERVAAISRDVSTLSTRAGAMQDTLDSVQARLDNLEALSGRIDALEVTTGGLQTNVKTLTTEVQSLDGLLKDLSAQTEALRSDMDAVTAQATRFQGVMDGLRDLLNNLFPVTK